jgi:S-DNA-T family DNA segregation ATPase FtsK/SpoIIIE
MSDTLKNILTSIFAIIFLLFGLIGILSMLSYSPYDPSQDFSANAVVKNWGGVIGANLSSFYMSFFGFGGYFISFTFAIWGITTLAKNFSKKADDFYDDKVKWFETPLMKFIFFITAIIFATSLISVADNYFKVPDDWVTNSYGGYLGFFVRQGIEPYIGKEFFIICFSLLSISTILLSLGISYRNWRGFFSILFEGIKLISLFIYRILSKVGYWIKYIFYRMMEDRSESVSEGDVDSGHKPIINSNEKEKDSYPTTTSKIRKIVEGSTAKKKPVINTSQQMFDIDMSGDFQLPPLSLLSYDDSSKSKKPSESSLTANADMLEKVLSDFGVSGKINEVEPGPVVTRYALEPAPGTKSSRVIGLADDIARSMSAVSARISVIPGQNAMGVELPNTYRETVYLKELLTSNIFKKSKAKLPLSLGKDISGNAVVIDLAKTPHLLVAGTTGSGKSVGLNAMILSLLYKYSPKECKFIMIDPKMLELSVYQDIPHLLSPVVTEPQKAVVALKWVVKEMENRYRLMANLNVRNIDGYNEKILQAKKAGRVLTRTVQTGYEPDTGKPMMEEVPLDMDKLPFIVVIVDEMADLMLVAGKEIEASIQRLAQMARAAGIHVILATQRPSVDVITGIIKANFPSRISYQVTSKIDSRTILGEMGAEQLLGMGDLLYMASGSKINRVHGPFVSDEEVNEVAKYLRSQGEPDYIEDVTTGDGEDMFMPSGGGTGGDGDKDALFDQAVAIIIRDNKVSTSYVQRALKIGYNRAANIIDQMEQDGIISEPDHVGRRKIMIK